MKAIGTTPPKSPPTPPQSGVPAGSPLASTEVPKPQHRQNDDFKSEELAVAHRRAVKTSRIHFVVHAGMHEIQAYAAEKGWLKQGFTQLSIPWQEVRWSTDNWKTTNVLKSFEVPSPIVNGFISLPNVPKGTTVKFAILAGVASHAPSDIAGYRERGETWLNNGGRDYEQVSS